LAWEVVLIAGRDVNVFPAEVEDFASESLRFQADYLVLPLRPPLTADLHGRQYFVLTAALAGYSNARHKQAVALPTSRSQSLRDSATALPTMAAYRTS
jgi:hypothetical protein